MISQCWNSCRGAAILLASWPWLTVSRTPLLRLLLVRSLAISQALFWALSEGRSPGTDASRKGNPLLLLAAASARFLYA